MAIEANFLSGGGRKRRSLAEEREIAFLRAERHSRLVGVLRKSLPVLAVLVLACYFISSRLSVSVGEMTASISGIEVSGGNLRMVNPTLKGADKKNGQYIIGADYADQDIKNPKMVKLHAIKAELSTSSGGWSRMEAARGVFNSQVERLVMQDKITIATSSGVTGEMKHASLDMKSQTLRSHRPVHFELPNGTVRANALTLLSAKSELVFRGKVHVHMVRPEKEEDKKAPAPGAKAAAPAASAPEATGAVSPETAPAQAVNAP